MITCNLVLLSRGRLIKHTDFSDLLLIPSNILEEVGFEIFSGHYTLPDGIDAFVNSRIFLSISTAVSKRVYRFGICHRTNIERRDWFREKVKALDLQRNPSPS